MVIKLLTLDSDVPNEDANSSTEQGWVKALEGAAKNESFVRWVVAQILRSTDSHAIRNAAAMALVDMNAKDQADLVVNTIVELQRKNDRDYGTLVYALDELGASLPFDILVDVIKQGSYEAKAEALLLVKDGRVTALKDAIRDGQLLQELGALCDSGDRDIANAAASAFDELGDWPRTPQS